VIRGGPGFDLALGLISRRIDVTQPFEIDLSGRTARVGVGRDRVFGVEAVTVRRLGTVLILGNQANNSIRATGRPVVIRGRGGNDFLHGGAHDDQLHGGAGDDEMEGGFGDDTLDGGTGTDTLHGGPGTDTCNDGEVVTGCP
jgi:Ca2+-binding RTX toxin-like protein